MTYVAWRCARTALLSGALSECRYNKGCLGDVIWHPHEPVKCMPVHCRRGADGRRMRSGMVHDVKRRATANEYSKRAKPPFWISLTRQ